MNGEAEDVGPLDLEQVRLLRQSAFGVGGVLLARAAFVAGAVRSGAPAWVGGALLFSIVELWVLVASLRPRVGDATERLAGWVAALWTLVLLWLVQVAAAAVVLAQALLAALRAG